MDSLGRTRVSQHCIIGNLRSMRIRCPYGNIGYMTLSKWLKANGVTGRRFAEDIGVSPALVSRWTAGLRTPSVDRIAAIDARTGGAVTWKDFVSASAVPPQDSPRAAA